MNYRVSAYRACCCQRCREWYYTDRIGGLNLCSRCATVVAANAELRGAEPIGGASLLSAGLAAHWRE